MKTKTRLLILFLFDLILVLWGASVAFVTFFIESNVLIFPTENVRLLLILFILFAVTSLAGLIYAILKNQKIYLKLFSTLQIIVFIMLESGKAIFG